MAWQLAAMGHRVLAVCRTAESAAQTRTRLLTVNSGADVIAIAADLSSQCEVRRLASEIIGRMPTVDVLINNAGCVSSRRILTQDNVELQLAVNHLAPVLLTYLLMPALERSGQGRVINVSSRAHARGKVHWDDLMLDRGYSLSKAYNQSKLCNLMWTFGLAEKLKGTRVTVNAFHPGLVNTGIGEKRTSAAEGFAWRMMKVLGRNPAEAARDGVHLAIFEDMKEVT